MTCQCRKGARCADCMERDSLSRTTDSPAFYEERIRLLEAENKRLRAALRVIFFEGGRINAVLVAEAALDAEVAS